MEIQNKNFDLSLNEEDNLSDSSMIKINNIINTSSINKELVLDEIISNITWSQVDKNSGNFLLTYKLPDFSAKHGCKNAPKNLNLQLIISPFSLLIR